MEVGRLIPSVPRSVCNTGNKSYNCMLLTFSLEISIIPILFVTFLRPGSQQAILFPVGSSEQSPRLSKQQLARSSGFHTLLDFLWVRAGLIHGTGCSVTQKAQKLHVMPSALGCLPANEAALVPRATSRGNYKGREHPAARAAAGEQPVK